MSVLLPILKLTHSAFVHLISDVSFLAFHSFVKPTASVKDMALPATYHLLLRQRVEEGKDSHHQCENAAGLELDVTSSTPAHL